MDHHGGTREIASDSTTNEVWLFAQAILGKPVPTPYVAAGRTRERHEQLARLAQFSPRHADEMRKLDSAEAEARCIRESLIWAASISTEAATKLRELLRKEAEAQRADNHCHDPYSSTIREWNEADHPRQPKGTPDGGQWAGKGGGASRSGRGTTGSAERIPASPSDASRWYLPSDAKVEWLGAKGHSTFRLKTPVEVNGKLVHDIQFTNGVPVLDKFALPGNTATIILTGDHDTDIRHAKEAWRTLNPGKKLPRDATFHHDLLHATEQTVVIDGKKTKVLVGKNAARSQRCKRGGISPGIC